MHVNPNSYEISSLKTNTIYLYLEISLYIKVRLIYLNSLYFQLSGTDLMFLSVLFCLLGHFQMQTFTKTPVRDR